MNSVCCHGSSLRKTSAWRTVHARFSGPAIPPVTRFGRAGRQSRKMAILNGDIVADDKLDSKEKTAAASSRGFAGLPEKPEDMRQSTPAASKFMQVRRRRLSTFHCCSAVYTRSCILCRIRLILPSAIFSFAGGTHSIVTTSMTTSTLKIPFLSSQTTQVCLD